MPYEKLLRIADPKLEIYERPMSPRNKGFYSDNIIWINRNLPTLVEKACALAEEIGHHETTVGDIIDQTKIPNRKQERRARVWAHERLVPLPSIVDAHKAGVRSRHELAEHLQVTESFLSEALQRYQEKYGLYVKVGNYTISFEPLGVIELFEF